MAYVSNHTADIDMRKRLRATLQADYERFTKTRKVTVAPGYPATPAPPRGLSPAQRIEADVVQHKSRGRTKCHPDEVRALLDDSRRLCRNRQATMEGLSMAAGLSRSAMSKYGTGECSPTPASLKELRRIIDELMGKTA